MFDQELELLRTATKAAGENVFPAVAAAIKAAANDEVMASNVQVSLRCPLAMIRLRVPVRGINCDHFQGMICYCRDLCFFFDIAFF